jgi:hypothetical protein
VTVVIPVYNGGRTIGPALQSVSNQTYTDYEVIVVDDGSTDDTAAEVAYAGPGTSDTNGRPTAARRAPATRRSASRAADSVAFLDADDVWLPRKLEAPDRATSPSTGHRPPAHGGDGEPGSDAHGARSAGYPVPRGDQRTTGAGVLRSVSQPARYQHPHGDGPPGRAARMRWLQRAARAARRRLGPLAAYSPPGIQSVHRPAAWPSIVPEAG